MHLSVAEVGGVGEVSKMCLCANRFRVVKRGAPKGKYVYASALNRINLNESVFSFEISLERRRQRAQPF